MEIDLTLSLGVGKKRYIADLTLPSFAGEMVAHLDPSFCNKYDVQLGTQWRLRDKKGKVHTVLYKKCKSHPIIIHGWPQIREFYELRGYHYFKLHFVGQSRFDISIFNGNNVEISYLKPRRRHPMPQVRFGGPMDLFQCQVRQTLTDSKARGYQLYLPVSILPFVRSCGAGPWEARGPRGGVMTVNIVSPSSSKYVKFGKGWKLFCRKHGISPGDTVVVKFTNKTLRFIVVEVSPALMQPQ